MLTIYEVLREVFKNNNFRLKFSQISIKRAISTEKDPQKAHQVCEYLKLCLLFCKFTYFKDKSVEYTLRNWILVLFLLFLGWSLWKPPLGGVLGDREVAWLEVELKLVD